MFGNCRSDRTVNVEADCHTYIRLMVRQSGTLVAICRGRGYALPHSRAGGFPVASRCSGKNISWRDIETAMTDI